MHASHRFDTLYRDLAAAWESHQVLRRSDASLSELVATSLQLDQARAAMRDWHSHHSSVTT